MGVVAFVSTNADNLLVLASLRSAGSVSRRSLSLGYLLGLAGVLLLVLMVAGLSRLIPVHLVGFLGVVPIAFGIRQLAAPDAGEAEAPLANGTRGEVALVASLQVASSGDTIAVAAPLLAESAVVPGLFTLAAFTSTGIAWLPLVDAVSRVGALRIFLERHAPRAAPLLMIAVGAYILANTLPD